MLSSKPSLPTPLPRIPAEPTLEIDLRNPTVAALLAWAWPGAGHLYQRRYAKGILFMACILGTYFFGLALAEGKVVYAAWSKVERRWQFIPQVAVGLPAAPAVVQALAVRRDGKALWNGFMAPPQGANDEERANQLSEWHKKLNIRFELGTLYTMIAGLLNILAIWDAGCGPVIGEPTAKERGPPEEKEKTS